MFARKKHEDPPRFAGPALAQPPGQTESLAVLHAFLSTSPPPTQQFVFNINTLEGPESALPTGGLGGGAGGPNISVPVPGVGQVSTLQFQAVYEQINQLLRRISGGADLSAQWTVDQVHTALHGLDGVLALDELTDEQYRSLKAALQSMLAAPS